MPRGGRSRGRSMSPVRSAPPRTVARAPAPAPIQRAPAPVQQQPAAMAPATANRPPGLLGQMAATAGGVAIGSAAGHMIGHAMTGGGGGQTQPEATYQEQPMQSQYAQQQQPQQQGATCAYELQQFMNCAQNTSDITFCQDFNEALKQCKQAYGMQ